MTAELIDPAAAHDVVESLRSGIPPKRFVASYSVGMEQFLKDVRATLLDSQSGRGKIRFLMGHWGSGKTHLLRLLRDEAFDADYLVSTVELDVDQTPFHKFEQVFYEVVRGVGSPGVHGAGDGRAAPFAEVLRRAILRGDAAPGATVAADRLREAKEALFANDGIDVDFRRVVAHYWDTFLPDAADQLALDDTRGRLLQWFAGEGGLSSYRAAFGVQKMVDRTNARRLLQSLGLFARHLGYRGLVVLFDEAEMAYSVMRRSSLKQAHNNLLHLINSIDESEGVFLIYAATPDFFVDDRYGIVNYGALAQRIGRPELRPPRALDRVWNLDAIKLSLEEYGAAARKIKEIYLTAYPDARARAVSDAGLQDYVAGLLRRHPEYSYVSTWRVVVGGCVSLLDGAAEALPPPPPEQLYDDVMARIREG